MKDAYCADEKGYWRYYKNPKNNIKTIQMYDEDNYSYKTAEEKNNNFRSHDNDTYNTLHCIFRHRGYIQLYMYIFTESYLYSL